ncbi:MAG: hypothetical protein DRI57_08895 [Deltaproteobacteria bacterium]|nr:MAG: hypothetical protein DRI57_08895 [Deltaproteobacteria bacterium]
MMLKNFPNGVITNAQIAGLEKAVKNAPKFGANYFYLAEAYALSHSYKKAIHTPCRRSKKRGSENRGAENPVTISS